MNPEIGNLAGACSNYLFLPLTIIAEPCDRRCSCREHLKTAKVHHSCVLSAVAPFGYSSAAPDAVYEVMQTVGLALHFAVRPRPRTDVEAEYLGRFVCYPR